MKNACAVLHLSIQDNVLEWEEDWPVLRVVLNDYGQVLEQVLVKEGVYAFEHFNNLQDIVNWLDDSFEGSHPEYFHVLVPAP